jgi:hypothetical protein
VKTRKRKKRPTEAVVVTFYYRTEEQRRHKERLAEAFERKIPGTRCVFIRETAPA